MLSPKDALELIRSHAPGTSTREALVAAHDVYRAMPRCIYRDVALRTLRGQIDAWTDHPSLESGRMDQRRVRHATSVLRNFLARNPEFCSKNLAIVAKRC
jgi:hypothetical protein